MNNEYLKNKKLYKLLMLTIKYIPITLTIFHIIALILNYNNIITPILSNFCGTSFIFVILLFIMSYVFRFCYLFRIPLIYIFIMNIMSTLRILGLLPLDFINLYRLYILISGLFILVFVIVMYKNRNNPKVDYISELCKRYNCEC